MKDSGKDLILTLDNGNRYTLINTITKDSVQYVCLTNIDNFGDIIFGKLDGNSLTVVNDNNLLYELIKEFNDMNQNN